MIHLNENGKAERWHVHGTPERCYVVTDDNDVIAFEDELTWDRAHLMAAAPELLEALQRLLSGIEWTPCTCDEAYTGRGLTDPDCQRCHLDLAPDELDAARAAIAKATGA